MVIILNDGTEINAQFEEKWYGNVYLPSAPVGEEMFTEENLSNVTIDGVDKGRLILDFISPDGLEFYLREPTEMEAEIYSLERKTGNMFVGNTLDNVPIGPNAVVTKVIDLYPPEGYILAAFREIAIQDATEGSKNKENVSLRWFGTAGGGTKANVNIINTGDEEAVIQLRVTGFFVKS